MLLPRLIPCLLIHKKGLVKTMQFGAHKYVGDPLNAVKIFNEKQCDELIVLDIDASSGGHSPNFNLIEKLANECRMPLCYGGGINTIEQAETILSLGVEKISISSAALQNPELIIGLSKRVGNQSIVIVLDVKKKKFGNKFDLFYHNGKKKSKTKLIEFVKTITNYGAGEIVINSIDNDGMMKGYNYNIIDTIRNETTLPITILGGVGSNDDIRTAIDRYKIIGVAAGSYFVFKGKYKAVLINYPDPIEKGKLLLKSNL